MSPIRRLSRAPDAPSCALSYRGWIPPSSFLRSLHGPASSRAHPDRSRLASLILYSDIPDSRHSGLFYNAYSYADTPVYPIYRAIPIVRQCSMTFQRVLYCSMTQIPILVRSPSVTEQRLDVHKKVRGWQRRSEYDVNDDEHSQTPLLKGKSGLIRQVWNRMDTLIQRVDLPGPIRQEVEMRARFSASATIYTCTEGPRLHVRIRESGTWNNGEARGTLWNDREA